MAGVQITGLKQTVRSLKRFGIEASDLKAAFRKIGNLVVGEAQTLVPVKTGRLQRSIKASNTQNKSVVRAGSGARIPYAGVIHYGGYHNIEPHPFLTDAVHLEHPAIVRTLNNELQGLIRKLNLR